MVYMKIIELTKEQFDDYALRHKNHNFYQTSQYGALMNRHGYIDTYIGLMDDTHNLMGASLILSQKVFGNFKSGYAPRGFLIDFNDFTLVETFTKMLGEYLFKQGYIYVKIDPYVIHMERDKKGNPLENGINNGRLIDLLKHLNYEHRGFSMNFENLKPRWNSITKINASSERLFSLFSKQTRNKIRKSYKKGVVIYKGNKDDLKMFYSLIDKKHSRKLNYYIDYYEIFSKNDMFDLYLAKLDPAIYVKTSKDLYELELKRNNDLTEKVQLHSNEKNHNHYISLKMNSDRLLDVYKNDIINANKTFASYPNGIIIAAAAVVKYAREIFFLIDGYNPKFKSFCPNHLMKWAIINEYAKKGYLYANHNAITGNFNKDNPHYGLYEFKRGFNSDVVEYIGEFDLIINRQVWNTYQQLKFFKNFFEFKK